MYFLVYLTILKPSEVIRKQVGVPYQLKQISFRIVTGTTSRKKYYYPEWSQEQEQNVTVPIYIR